MLYFHFFFLKGIQQMCLSDLPEIRVANFLLWADNTAFPLKSQPTLSALPNSPCRTTEQLSLLERGMCSVIQNFNLAWVTTLHGMLSGYQTSRLKLLMSVNLSASLWSLKSKVHISLMSVPTGRDSLSLFVLVNIVTRTKWPPNKHQCRAAF